jgi:hypothetical protein
VVAASDARHGGQQLLFHHGDRRLVVATFDAEVAGEQAGTPQPWVKFHTRLP